jgi:hypothetical protein
MKRKLALLALVFGLTWTAAWTKPAEALPPYCHTRCKPTTSPTYPCTCVDTLQVTTCGQWTAVCL